MAKIIGVYPALIALGGGTTITILGEGFTGAELVTFVLERTSSVDALSFVVVSDTEISAVTPPVDTKCRAALYIRVNGKGAEFSALKPPTLLTRYTNDVVFADGELKRWRALKVR